MVEVEFEFGPAELMIVTGVVDGRAQQVLSVSLAPVLHAEPLLRKKEATSPVVDARTVKPKRAAVPAVGSIHAKSVEVAAPPTGV